MRTSRRAAAAVGRPDLDLAVRARSGAPLRRPRCSRAAISGTTSASGRPIAAIGSRPSSSRRRRFGRLIRPPVEPDDARRHAGQHRFGEPPALVELAVGLDQFARCAASWLVMRLKARLSPASSSSAAPSATRAARSPARTRSAATISRPIGRAAGWRDEPDSTAASSTSSATTSEDQREGDLQPGPVAVELLVLRDRALGRAADVVEHLRVDRRGRS